MPTSPLSSSSRGRARALRWLLPAGLLAVQAAGFAQALPPPEGVLTLSASATVEVPKDWMSVAFGVTREGNDAGAVQTQLKQAVDAALAEARRIAKPGQVEVKTGSFSIYPRYSQKGTMNGWQGSTELLVEGRDMDAIAQLSGRIASMTISRVGYGLSREAREKVEGEVSAQAIVRFRARAAELAKQFGYGGYALREVNVSAEQSGEMQPRARDMMMMAKAGGPEALPVEAGKGTVTATVNGSIQMK
ncbi:MAG TPA: SIMPL domain-containing protein [Ideonella sp.]|nr:SIMPL domain-containing protein [Ideonella sp.]